MNPRIVWLADKYSPHIERWMAPLEKLGVKPHVISLPRLRPRIRYAAQLMRINKEVRACQPEIIHAHYASSYGAISSLVGYQCPRVTSVWGSDVSTAHTQNVLYRMMLKRALRQPEVVIVNSKYLGEIASQLVSRQYLHIPFGVPLEDHLADNRGVKLGEEITIVCVKRLHPVAGIDRLLRAVTQIQLAFSDRKISFIIAGTGSEEGRLKAYIRKHGLEEVKFVGQLTPDQVRNLYIRADLSVFPSRQEGLGVSTIESMACGTPVVATNTGGLSELLREGQHGWCVDRPDMLGSVIITALERYGESLKRAAAAREHVRQEYNIANNAAKLVESYQSLLQS